MSNISSCSIRGDTVANWSHNGRLTPSKTCCYEDFEAYVRFFLDSWHVHRLHEPRTIYRVLLPKRVHSDSLNNYGHDRQKWTGEGAWHGAINLIVSISKISHHAIYWVTSPAIHPQNHILVEQDVQIPLNILIFFGPSFFRGLGTHWEGLLKSYHTCSWESLVVSDGWVVVSNRFQATEHCS